jgi:hypothetical protein
LEIICEEKIVSTGKTVFTSDHALKLEWIPDWIAIIGSGYIGLEFSDVYTALGSEVRINISLTYSFDSNIFPVHLVAGGSYLTGFFCR